jgi:transposase InsO family protein
MMWVTFLKEKSKAFEKLKIFKAKVENESRSRIKCLRSERGGEFTSDSFNHYCEEHGIYRQTSNPRTPQQNGVAERRNIIILNAARTMLIEGNVAHIHMKEVVGTAVYTLRYLMSYGLVIHLLRSISESLATNATSKEMMKLESLMQEVMKVFFLVTQLSAKHIDVSI